MKGDAKTLKDYILLLRNNLKYFFIFPPVILSIAIVYVVLAKDIYISSAKIKITKQTENVLEDTRQSNDPGFVDRFIANEIITMTDYSVREKIAQALIDSFNNTENKNLFSLVRSGKGRTNSSHKSVAELAGTLGGVISVEPVSGTDMVRISAESPSPIETAIIANTCAREYQELNLAINRQKLTNIRKFLEDQRDEKLLELKGIEDSLMKFQEKGGIVSIDVQSTDLINQLSQLEAQKEVTRMELMTSNEILKQYKFFLGKQDPQLVNYLENQTSQAYINALQQQIADLQVNRDIALSIKNPNVDISDKVTEYDQRINELQEKLNTAISGIKADAFSGNPQRVQELAQKIIDEEINNNTLAVRLSQLESITQKYEGNLKRLPKTSTQLAQFQRNRETTQQLYLLINERYQEAMITELSQPGNVSIVSEGEIPIFPSKPDRKIILIFSLIIGSVITFGFIIIKDYLNSTIKTPEDIEKSDINFLSWVPQYKTNGNGLEIYKDLVTLYEQDSPISESFRAIRARIIHSRLDSEIPKTILVTSPAEHEGKTFVCVNLAGSFAKSNKRTLIIDCDLRRPRVQEVLGVDKKPGLVDYLAGTASLEEIIRVSRNNNLSFITSGSISPNPAEILESDALKDFIMEVRDWFDVIIIDSAPIIAVIDAEILSKIVDGTILVVSADKTENRLMKDAVQLIKQNNVLLLGTVLNNFKYKSGYGYYYKYYYNYSKDPSKKKGRKIGFKS
ncbi:MAG: polysaccharide biosynthesis tyrosine autokinase [bacterium]|nr:polysaccharide biosynthesis tyrosine autokinase [bacterium]